MKSTRIYLVVASSLLVVAVLLAIAIWFVVRDLEDSKKEINTQKFLKLDTDVNLNKNNHLLE